MTKNSDVASWFDGRSNVLFIHAHPDDESIGTGGVLAALTEAGRDPHLLTLTRGEMGETRYEVQDKLDSGVSLADLRVEELSRALEELGLTQGPQFLGGEEATYEDSGMEWGPDGLAVASSQTSDRAVTRAQASVILNSVIDFAVEVEAEAIVSYDEIGGYGHPDHILAHRLGRAVATGLEIDFWEIGMDPQATEFEHYDVSAWGSKKMAALDHYRSQLAVVGEYEVEHVGGQRHQISTVESFRKLPILEPGS